MQTDRRSLLKGLAAAGLAVSGMGLAQVASALTGKTAASSDVLAVTSALHGSALDAAFAAGVQDTALGAAHTGLQGLDSAAFNQLGELLADGKARRLLISGVHPGTSADRIARTVDADPALSDIAKRVAER